ncbi:MAG: hypothetical protein PVSMB7_11440 [Chloroflexota bacterium]
MSTRTQAIRWKIARRHLNQRKTHRLRWTLILVLIVLLMTSGASAAAGIYFTSHLPSASSFHVHYAFQDARIYDSQGALLYDMSDLSRKAGKRVVEPLQDRYDTHSACRGGVNRIPTIVQNATIATEDATFYKNPGFDPGSIVRAAYQDIVYGHIVSGASTITQQLVKTNILGDERSLTRKAQEVALAYQISKRFPKRKILWYYLNSVPYGNTAIGAQAAAEVYFGRQICRLDMAQAAMLAGLPRAPSLYDPVRYRGAALQRLNTVLHLMRKHGYLHTRAQIAAALHEAAGWRFHTPQATMRYPQFTRYVVDQMQQMPALRGRLYQGIDVYTTLRPKVQDMAQRTVTRQIDSMRAQHVTNGALVSLDLRPHHYGWILAMVGSAHYADTTGQINMAVVPRQPGSSMKPFNYIWAFTHSKVGPGTTVVDSPVKLPDPNSIPQRGWYQPENYDHLWHGPVTLRQALANSLNVPAVKLEYYITKPHNVAQTAASFGMSSLYRDNPGLDCSVCYAVTLGGLAKGTRLLEETAAYGAFATTGWTVPPVAIWKVVQRGTGAILYCSADCGRHCRPDAGLQRARRQVVDSAHAYEMTDVLSDNNARCTPQVCEFGLNSPLVLSRPSAAKTGTTNSFTDNWTVGYTPQIVTGVWVGNSDRSPMQNVIGVAGAGPIWHDYMESAFRMLHLPVERFVAPAGVVRTTQCATARPNAYRIVTSDLLVQSDQAPYSLPLCSLPERGFLPVPCSQYPRNPSGFPFAADCTSLPGYTYTYTYGNGFKVQLYSGNGQANQFPQSPPGNVTPLYPQQPFYQGGVQTPP